MRDVNSIQTYPKSSQTSTIVKLASNKKGTDDAFCWDHYFRFVGVLELNPDIKLIYQRTRNAIKGMTDASLSRCCYLPTYYKVFWYILYTPILSGVYYCDITIPQVFMVPVGPLDVIIASLVFDVVAVSDSMYISALKNVLQYLKVKL